MGQQHDQAKATGHDAAGASTTTAIDDTAARPRAFDFVIASCSQSAARTARYYLPPELQTR